LVALGPAVGIRASRPVRAHPERQIGNPEKGKDWRMMMPAHPVDTVHFAKVELPIAAQIGKLKP
jgi:hypothetical protein